MALWKIRDPTEIGGVKRKRYPLYFPISWTMQKKKIWNINYSVMATSLKSISLKVHRSEKLVKIVSLRIVKLTAWRWNFITQSALIRSIKIPTSFIRHPSISSVVNTKAGNACFSLDKKFSKRIWRDYWSQQTSSLIWNKVPGCLAK